MIYASPTQAQGIYHRDAAGVIPVSVIYSASWR